MATNTTNYGFKKPDESDFYDVADQNKNWDLADEALKNLDTPTFEDYTGSTAVPSATDAIDQIKSKGKLGTLLSNIKAAFKGACLIGHIVNNCVTDNAGLPLSAAQGKALKDLYTQLYSDLNTTNNNLSNGLYGTTQDTTLDQLMKHMSDWNHPFVFDIGYTLPIAPDKNNAVGIGERGMLHAFSYSGKHFYCIDASKGWQESPYALKSDLINTKYLVNEFNAYNDTIVLTSTATDGSKIQLSTDGTNLYLNKKLKGATDWTTVWKK